MKDTSIILENIIIVLEGYKKYELISKYIKSIDSDQISKRKIEEILVSDLGIDVDDIMC